VINDTDIPTAEILGNTGWIPDMASKALMDALVTWTTTVAGGPGANRRKGTLFDRDQFVCPDNPYEQMRLAYDAADDDIVGSFLDASEALAFSSIRIECDDPDQQDIWTQIAEGVDLDSRMREIWRDLNITSQATVAVWYGKKSFKVRGKSGEGIRRKKTYDLTVPMGITVLDPLRIVPMGAFLFNTETLCYFAQPAERDIIDSWLLGDDASGADPIIERLIIAKYEPDYRDRKELGNMGIDPNRLYVLDPKYVWRHTVTRPAYMRFPPLRMKRVFELLDLKRQLKASDRALLLGAGNFIVLVTKGSDKDPGKPMEIEALKQHVRSLGRSVVLVGDQRLHVEIITPKTDDTVNEAKYGTLNLALQDTLWGMFVTTHAGRDDSLKLARVVAKGLESRRAMQRRSFMNNVFYPTFEMNDALTAEPTMVFHPKRIALDFDPSLATYLLDLFDRGAISRASVLSEVDYDEGMEALKREVEISLYDKTFLPPNFELMQQIQARFAPTPGGGAKKSPATPPSNTAPKPGGTPAGAPNSPKSAGRSGGGNHGAGGNGGKNRGAGQAPQRGDTHAGTYTAPGSAAPKGVRSRPPLEKHGQTASEEAEELLEEFLDELTEYEDE
jgi:hypothetical protein